MTATGDSGAAAPANTAATDEKKLPPAALRALAEAEARRKTAAQMETSAPREIGGRGGREPIRYGDWEIKGKAVDF